tara:strand:+ start:300 stop:584 length:285 start_codon:yes stop_codon:yes gene_type:complete
MLYPLFDTLDAHGNEHIVNFNHISHIKYTTLEKAAMGRAGKSPCGPKGAAAIRVVMTNGCSILISCDWDGEDLTEDFEAVYKDYFERMHKQTGL